MLQIGYVSTASGEQDPATLEAILTASRRYNQRWKISGLLVAGSGRYLQIIEGPHRPVEHLYSTIRSDRRHDAIITIVDRPIVDRAFGEWDMAFHHEARLGEADTVLKAVMLLTAPVGDPILRTQIRTFASLLLSRTLDCTAKPWAQAG